MLDLSIIQQILPTTTVDNKHIILKFNDDVTIKLSIEDATTYKIINFINCIKLILPHVDFKPYSMNNVTKIIYFDRQKYTIRDIMFYDPDKATLFAYDLANRTISYVNYDIIESFIPLYFAFYLNNFVISGDTLSNIRTDICVLYYGLENDKCDCDCMCNCKYDNDLKLKDICDCIIALKEIDPKIRIYNNFIEFVYKKPYKLILCDSESYNVMRSILEDYYQSKPVIA